VEQRVDEMATWLAAWSRWQEERHVAQWGPTDPEEARARRRRLLVGLMSAGFAPLIGVLVFGARLGWF
jgi:hypothetical protein